MTNLTSDVASAESDATGSWTSSLRVRPGGLLVAMGAVATAATLLGFLGSFWWFFELFSHFRVQYASGLLLVGTALLLLRRPRTGLSFLAIASVNAAVIIPLYLGAADASAGGGRLRLVSMNVHTQLGDPERVRREVLQWMPDVIVLLEVNQRWARRLGWLSASHPYSIVETREDNFGIALYSNRPLSKKQTIWLGSALLPTATAEIEIDGVLLTLLATHPLPPTGRENAALRNEQLQRIADFAANNRPIIVVGDLNTTPWSPHFRRLLRDGNLLNSAQGYGIQATWPQQSLLFRIPIDHCLHSPDVKVIGRKVGDDIGSDHFPVVVDIARSDE